MSITSLQETLHGVCIFLPSLWSHSSCGVGELYDLLPLLDWAAIVGLSVIQLLPIYDTAEDPSPYLLHSAHALNPVYLSLHVLPGARDVPQLLQGLRSLQSQQGNQVDYKVVRHKKMAWLRDYFSCYAAQILADPKIALFIENCPWIKGYALYQIYKNKFNTDKWQEWPLEYRNLSPEEVDKHFSQHFFVAVFYVFVQMYLYQQLEEVSSRAIKNNVLLKGDIPFGLSLNSVDVWLQPHLFHLDYVLGCEPDPVFNPLGQKWGMPLYYWDRMQEDGLKWWRARIERGSQYFSLLRLDHVAGFFRVWGVPSEGHPLEGQYFAQKENIFFAGVHLLKQITEGSAATFVGEDLGKGVPPGLHRYLHDCNIFSTTVFRWEEPLSVQSMTTLGTHDMEPLSTWWSQGKAFDKKHFFTNGIIYKGASLTASVRESILLASHSSKSLLHINLFNEYLSYFQEFVPKYPNLERINIPGVVHRDNWSGRMVAPVEEIVQHQGLRDLFFRILTSCKISV